MAWQSVVAPVLRPFRRLISFCRSCILAAVVTLVGIWLIGIFFGVVWPRELQAPLLTTTVSAATESYSFRTPDGRESAWSLPPGEFSILGTSNSDRCNANAFEAVCNYSENTRLVVTGAADVTMHMSPRGGWLLSVAETVSAPAEIALYDTEGEVLLQSRQLLEYNALSPKYAIRFPFVADSAVLGADLHQSSTIDGSPYDFWQPVLLSGDVLMIADNRPSRETYRVLEERLDPGDVIHVGNSNAPDKKEGRSTVWGMVTVASGDATSSVGTTVFHVILHTSLNEVRVTRFGAPDGHVIRASKWTISQKWPNGQSAWVLFVSLVLVFTFVLELHASMHACRDDELKEKPEEERT